MGDTKKVEIYRRYWYLLRKYFVNSDYLNLSLPKSSSPPDKYQSSFVVSNPYHTTMSSESNIKVMN